MVRLYLVYFFTLFFALFIIAKIIHIQAFEGYKIREASEERTYKWRDINAKRGVIYSSDGYLLTHEVPYYDIFFDPLVNALRDSTFFNNIDALGDSLQKYFGVNAEGFVSHMKNIRKGKVRANRHYPIVRNISWQEKELLKTFPIFNLGWLRGGLIKYEYFQTFFPYGNLARRTIGMVDADRDIAFGLSHRYDSLLAGQDGKFYTHSVRHVEGYPINHPESRIIEPKRGYDLVSTIDLRIQDVAAYELKKVMKQYEVDSASVVVMEVQTGFIKAIVNLRNNHNGTFSEVLNYAVSNQIDPGSTMKLPAFMVAFEDGFIQIDDTIDCRNGYIRMYNQRDYSDVGTSTHGRISVRDVFKHSSNVGTVQIIDKYYNRTNLSSRDAKNSHRRKFTDGLYRMRLNQRVNTEIENEPLPVINNNDFHDLTLLQMSIGYELSLTPLQLLTFYNAVANDGVMMKPRFVREVRDDTKLIKQFEPIILKEQIASPQTISFAKELLEAVVEEGSARTIRNTNGYRIAGKTGTSLLYHSVYGYNHKEFYNSSFAGYFPADTPKYSAIVVLHAPNILKGSVHGGRLAAPVFKNIADFIYGLELGVQDMHKVTPVADNVFPFYKGMQRDLDMAYRTFGKHIVREDPSAIWVKAVNNENLYVFERKDTTRSKTPDVVGLSLRDAIYLLENYGFKVSFQGVGHVKSQSVDAGTPYKKGDVIELKLSM